MSYWMYNISPCIWWWWWWCCCWCCWSGGDGEGSGITIYLSWLLHARLSYRWSSRVGDAWCLYKMDWMSIPITAAPAVSTCLSHGVILNHSPFTLLEVTLLSFSLFLASESQLKWCTHRFLPSFCNFPLLPRWDDSWIGSSDCSALLFSSPPKGFNASKKNLQLGLSVYVRACVYGPVRLWRVKESMKCI